MKFNIIVTFSKLMAFLMLILAFAFGFYMKSLIPVSIALPVVAAALGWKQKTDKDKAAMNSLNNDNDTK